MAKLVSGQLDDGYLRLELWSAEAFSQSEPGSEQRRELFERTEVVIKTLESVTPDDMERAFPDDESALKAIADEAVNVLAMSRDRLDRAKQDMDAPYTNQESLVQQAVSDYCHNALYVANTKLAVAKISPELHSQAQLAQTLFESSDILGNLQSRTDTFERLASTTQTPEQHEILWQWARPSIGRLPPAHLAAVHGIVVNQWGQAQGSSQEAAMHADMQGGRVLLHLLGAPDYDEYYLKTSITHEIGHVVHGALLKSTTQAAQEAVKTMEEEFRRTRQAAGLPEQPASRESWEEVKLTANHAMIVNAPSDYSLTNDREWFAEQYADYVYYPSRLERNHPRVFETLKGVFGGMQYRTGQAVPIPPGEEPEDVFALGHELADEWGKI